MQTMARLCLLVTFLVTALVAGCGPAGEASAPVTTSPGTPAPSWSTGLAPVGPTETALVVRIVDGDTIIIDRGYGDERLRYVGIDAPESVKPDTPVAFMGHEASAANAALVAGREVVLERDVSDRDRFDRLLRYVWLREGDTWLLVNLELVRQGYASAVSFPPDVRLQDALRAAERVARDAALGLWGPATPLP
jgi:micrococcal nuclease